jgi:hypothetical protein
MLFGRRRRGVELFVTTIRAVGVDVLRRRHLAPAHTLRQPTESQMPSDAERRQRLPNGPDIHLHARSTYHKRRGAAVAAPDKCFWMKRTATAVTPSRRG